MTGSGSPMAGRRSLQGLRVLAALVLTVHGLVHLMGVALLWRWAGPGELRYDDVHPSAGSTPRMVVGAGRLVAMLLVLVAAVLLPSASIAWAGLVVDVAVLVSAVLAVAAARRRLPSPAWRSV